MNAVIYILTKIKMLENGYGIMPNKVLYDKELSDKEKLIYCVVSSLCAEKWFCWASNKYIWDMLDCKEWTISKAVSKLVSIWYLTSYVDRSKGNVRHLSIGTVKNHNTSCEISQDPSCEKSQDIITIDNNINNKEDDLFKQLWSAYPRMNFRASDLNKSKAAWSKKTADEQQEMITDALIYKFEVRYKIADAQYVRKLENWIDWFSISDWTYDDRLYKIIDIHRRWEQDDTAKKRLEDLKQAFWKAKVNELWKKWSADNNTMKMTFK